MPHPHDPRLEAEITSPILIPSDEHVPGTRLDEATSQQAAQVFLRHGACLLESVLPDGWVDEALRAADDAFAERLGAAGGGEGGEGMGLGLAGGFHNIVQRMEGRYDMLLRQGDCAAPFAAVMDLEEAPWGGIIRALLGADARLMSAGLLMTLPGAAPHPWHSDGPPLFTGPDAPVLPPHCVNVFLPLVDQGIENGGTDLRLGTHRRTGPRPAVVWSLTAAPPPEADLPVSLVCPRGSVLLFDYRLQHRAHPHTGSHRRSVLYLSYARHWFQDSLNFPDTPLPSSGGGA